MIPKKWHHSHPEVKTGIVPAGCRQWGPSGCPPSGHPKAAWRQKLRDVCLNHAWLKPVALPIFFDADGASTLPTQKLQTAQIDAACKINNNAHEHHEWPICPMPEHQLLEVEQLQEMETELVEGTWQDGNAKEDSRQDQSQLAREGTPGEIQSQGMGDNSQWQGRNLSTSLSTALKRACRLGYSNAESLYVKVVE